MIADGKIEKRKIYKGKNIQYYMMMKKRGLSDVVTVTLIILLAVAAVVIVWAFVRSTIEEAGKDIKADCIKTNLKVIRCAAGGSPVVVENGAGGEIVNSVKLIYYNLDESKSTPVDGADCVNIVQLGRGSCTVAVADLPAADDRVKVKATPVFVTGSDQQICPITGQAVTCPPAPAT